MILMRRSQAHARSGDPAEISGYLGRGDRFERALAALTVSSSLEELHANSIPGDTITVIAADFSPNGLEEVIGQLGLELP